MHLAENSGKLLMLRQDLRGYLRDALYVVCLVDLQSHLQHCLLTMQGV